MSNIYFNFVLVRRSFFSEGGTANFFSTKKSPIKMNPNHSPTKHQIPILMISIRQSIK